MELRTHGFTLVELMIAMLLSAMVMIITYQLFDTTADALGEVDSLAESTAQARFAMERLRTDFAMAGGLGTPDSANDIWTEPDPTPAGRIIGLAAYDGWQDNTTLSDQGTALYKAANIGGGAEPYVSADGVIVMGAYDFPMGFEVTGFNDVGIGNPAIPSHSRGLFKLFSPDPFRTGGDAPTGADFNNSGIVNFFSNQWGTRILRVSDRQGYQQYVGLDGMGVGDFNMANGTTPSSISLNFSDAPIFQGAGNDYGLDVNPDGDTSYDSALIDAFWYHVEADEEDDNLVRLVRTRLCAGPLATALAANPKVDPNAFRANTCGGTAEDVVVAERVADFQLWFDCGTVGSGKVENAVWSDTWVRPNPNDDANHCMNIDNAGYSPHLVRLLHMRISIHAESERPDLRHSSFEDAAGNFGNAAIVATPNVRLKTYDIVPDLLGAAPVVTLQTTVELMNHSIRNPI